MSGAAIAASISGTLVVLAPGAVTPPSGLKVRIYRATPTDPLVVFSTQSLNDADTHQIANRQAVYLQQENADTLGAAVRVAGGSLSPITANEIDRANKLIAFDATGTMARVVDSAVLPSLGPTAGVTVYPAGSYAVTSNTTVANDVYFEPGAVMSIATGVTVTFNGNVDGPPSPIFSGTGKAVLNGQHSIVYAEWWGADPAGIADSATAFRAMNEALPNGAICLGQRGSYQMGSAVDVTNPIHFWGAARDKGTTFAPTSTFAAGGSALFTLHNKGAVWRDFTIEGPDVTTGWNYIGIQTLDNFGAARLDNIRVRNVAVGFDFVAGTGGTFVELSVENFRVAGYRFGGATNTNVSGFRFIGGTLTNSNASDVTNGATASGNVIHMADTTNVAVGMAFAADQIAPDTTVLSKDATSVTLSNNVLGTVASGATVRFGWHLHGEAVRFQENSSDLAFTDLHIFGGRTWVRAVGQSDTGKASPSGLCFTNLRAEASEGYNGIRLEAGNIFRFNHCWMNDVPFGSTVSASSSDNTSAHLSNLHFNDTLIGGGGRNGVNLNYVTNISFDNSYVVGCGKLASNTYDAVTCSANTRGHFEFVGGHSGNDSVDGLTGVSSSGITLLNGSFAGTGDSINIEAKLGGLTIALVDGSSPAFPLKTVNQFGGSAHPAFRAAPTSAQTIGAAAGWTRVAFGTEQYDFGGYFSASKFTPIAGAYQLNASVGLGSATDWQMAIYKNGSSQSARIITGQRSAAISDTVLANGTDYFEVFVNIPAGATLEAGGDITFFSGG